MLVGPSSVGSFRERIEDPMIDFTNGALFKLKPVDASEGTKAIADLVLDDETVTAAYKGARDMVIFTSKRIVAVNVQGMTGKKIDYSTLPYSKIQAFSIETAGSFDRDSELEIWFSGLGKVRLEFGGAVDIRWIGRWLAHHCL
jgi:hypothetical protein